MESNGIKKGCFVYPAYGSDYPPYWYVEKVVDGKAHCRKSVYSFKRIERTIFNVSELRLAKSEVPADE